MPEPTDKLRADARANRDRILEVARDALALDPTASLNSIAKEAGVGIGTLYRHYPTREALIIGVYRKEIDALVALAPALLAEHSPLHALRLWCDRLAEYGRAKHGVADMLKAAISDKDFQETYWPMMSAVRRLLDACIEHGEISQSIAPEDFLVLVGFLWRIPPSPSGEAQAERLLDVVFHGLSGMASQGASRHPRQ